MSANQDLYAAAQAAIEKRRALVAAGTPGPWRALVVSATRSDIRGLPENTNYDARGDSVATAADSEFGACKDADAALITTAVNAFAADTEALAAVLERHAPIECPDHVDCPAICDICGIEDWPCADALDALTALGVAP